MPLYEYECDACGHRFEVIQKFSDEPLTTHDKCRGAVHLLVSAAALAEAGEDARDEWRPLSTERLRGHEAAIEVYAYRRRNGG